jgi:DNA modification methylase
MEYELYLGDALDLLARLPEHSVEAIITDLPYEVTQCEWDSIIPFAPMWSGVKRVLKTGGVFASTAQQPFSSKLVMSNPSWFKYEWIWEKSRKTGFLDCDDKPLKAHENIEVFYESKSTYNPQMIKGLNHIRGPVGTGPAKVYGDFSNRKTTESNLYYPSSILYFPVESNPQHPTQKPVSLYEYLILTYTNPGDTVLDFCFGSVTTGVACMVTGRRFIGGEKDPGYFKIGESRLAAAAAQPLLPGVG